VSYFAPFGNNPGEVISPDELQREFDQARRIADGMTHWQMSTSDRAFDRRIIKTGSSVIVHRREQSSIAGHGGDVGGDWPHHADAEYMTWMSSGLSNVWLIPSQTGWSEIYDGDCSVSWVSEYTELVMFCSSWRSYRLSGKGAGGDDAIPERSEYFGSGTKPRIKIGLMLDGSVIEGSGPGTGVGTSSSDTIIGGGMYVKAVKSSSVVVRLLGAGQHRVSPVAMQHIGQKQNRVHIRQVSELDYFQSGDDSPGTEFGVGIPSCNMTVIRFPRGKWLGA